MGRVVKDKERNESERRREGAWISRPDTPGQAKLNHKFPNERRAGPTLEHRAQPACQITIATSMTHNAPHHSLEHTDEAGNPEVTQQLVLMTFCRHPQTQQSCNNRQNTPLTEQKQNKVHCGYYNCVGKTDAYFWPPAQGRSRGWFTGNLCSPGPYELILQAHAYKHHTLYTENMSNMKISRVCY